MQIYPSSITGDGFAAGDLSKSALAADSPRQAHFEAELLRIAEDVGSSDLPVFVQFRSGERRRMDKGCVGHAVARGFVEPPVNGRGGLVTTVTLRSGAGARANG